MNIYRAALVGCGRMGAFIDNEVTDYPAVVFPYSHAAGYEACPRTVLVACSDLRTDMMAEVGKRYGVPSERQYTDYRELIDRERPDILSVATQPEQRAEIVVYAAEHGVKAIYAEKAMAASMAEADAMVRAVEAHRVSFNMGTNRRWGPGYDKMKEIIDSGELGALRTVTLYNNGTLFNTASHTFDLALRLNSDRPVSWVQAHLPQGDAVFDGEIVRQDPACQGMFQAANGVMVYALLTPRYADYEAICERGVLTALNNGVDWEIRRQVPIGRTKWSHLVMDRFPAFDDASSTLRLIEDLVHSLDTGEPTRGGVRVARANMELIFGCIESHRRGGARVPLPLKDCPLRLDTRPAPRSPKLSP